MLQKIQTLVAKQLPFAIATVIKTWGSAPRPIGSMLLIGNDMEMIGSVSGGCVEGAVLREAKTVIASGEAKLLSYGVTNEDAWSVGLSCGGQIEIFVERCIAFDKQKTAQDLWTVMNQQISAEKPFISVRLIENGLLQSTLITPDGNTYGSPIPTNIHQAAMQAYHNRRSCLVGEAQRYFIQPFSPKHQILIIGSAHISAALVKLAKWYDFETVVIDPRGVFTEKTEYEVEPDEVITSYPSEVLERFDLGPYTYAVVLSHDPKIDDNALAVFLRSDVAYIGALGGRNSRAKRLTRLTAAGFTPKEIERIHAPIGLAIKAQGAKEIALSIMAELVKVKNSIY